MKNYKLIIAYDGTDYYGWQKQKHEAQTITHLLQDSFESVFKKEIRIMGASRTDAGVHATGQTACFQTDLGIDPQQLLFAWQNILPSSILLRSIKEVPLDWHPRADVRQKTYYYHFFQVRVLPFQARYGWYYRYPVDIDKLKQVVQVFIGTHDFRSFCTGDDYEKTITRIDDIQIEYLSRYKTYRIIVKGPSFFRYMIRRIVGASLLVAASKSMQPEDLKVILEQKNPEQLLYTAPAKGLLLYKIIYKDEEWEKED